MMTSDNAITLLMLEKLCGDLRARIELQRNSQIRSKPSTNGHVKFHRDQHITAMISILCGFCLTAMTM